MSLEMSQQRELATGAREATPDLATDSADQSISKRRIWSSGIG